MIISFTLNDEAVTVQTEPDQRLVEILRKNFGLTGAKRDCLIGVCGSCTVLFSGKIVPSCMVPAFSVKDQTVVTIEGFAKTWDYVDIERGFLRAGVRLCGHCAAGKVLATHVLLEENSSPNDQEILEAFSGVRCRCDHHRSLIHAVKLSSEIRKRRKSARKS